MRSPLHVEANVNSTEELGSNVISKTKKYGSSKSKGNLALWATILKFNHPVSKEKLTFKVIPPIDTEPWKSFHVEKFL